MPEMRGKLSGMQSARSGVCCCLCVLPTSTGVTHASVYLTSIPVCKCVTNCVCVCLFVPYVILYALCVRVEFRVAVALCVCLCVVVGCYIGERQ